MGRKIRLKWPTERKMTLTEFLKHAESLKPYSTCLNCRHCLPIGEGDHICIVNGEHAPVLVIDEYMPTGLYMYCKGEWEARE